MSESNRSLDGKWGVLGCWGHYGKKPLRLSSLDLLVGEGQQFWYSQCNLNNNLSLFLCHHSLFLSVYWSIHPSFHHCIYPFIHPFLHPSFHQSLPHSIHSSISPSLLFSLPPPFIIILETKVQDEASSPSCVLVWIVGFPYFPQNFTLKPNPHAAFPPNIKNSKS